ncbi:MAG: glycosyltransferase [bacterium]
MNIAIFTNNYLPNPYGVAASIESFRKEFEKRGHTVYIFAPRDNGYFSGDEGISPGRIFFYPAINFKFKGINFPLVFPYSYRISRILEKMEIDVVHSQHPNLLGWVAAHWAKKKNVPLVFTWHTLYDQYAHFAPAFVPRKFALWWTLKNAVSFANKASQVVVPTFSAKKIIEKWGVKNKNIVTIPTGILKQDFSKIDRQLARGEHAINEDRIVLGLICRITKEKNVLFLAKIVALLLQKNENLVFVLAGDGDEIATVKRIFAQENIGDRFKYLGVVGGKEKNDFFAMSDIFVYASKSETQGMVLIEAMQAGLPIVAINATGTCDVVEDGNTGFLVDENEEVFMAAVLKLIENKNLRQEFGEKSKMVFAKKYTSSACAYKMLEMYQKNIKKEKMS